MPHLPDGEAGMEYRDSHKDVEAILRGDAVPDSFAPLQYCLSSVPLTPARRALIERGPFFKLSHKATQVSKGAKGSKSCGERIPVGGQSVLHFFLTTSTSTSLAEPAERDRRKPGPVYARR